jgi:hypothetical protein
MAVCQTPPAHLIRAHRHERHLRRPAALSGALPAVGVQAWWRGAPGHPQAVERERVHPVMSAPVGRWMDDDQGVRRARVIGDYFYQGPLTETWSFRTAPAQVRDRYQPFTITYARRTLTGWLSAVLAAGLVIEAIAEPHADERTAAAHPEVADTRIAPYFLVVRARKP